MSDLDDLLADGQVLDQLAVALAPRLADELVPRLADALRELPATEQPDEWVSAAEIARRFSLGVYAVYAHKDEFGVRGLPPRKKRDERGKGKDPKPRLRFNPRIVEQALTSRGQSKGSQSAGSPAPAGKSRRPPRRRNAPSASRVPLIPIRGRHE